MDKKKIPRFLRDTKSGFEIPTNPPYTPYTTSVSIGHVLEGVSMARLNIYKSGYVKSLDKKLGNYLLPLGIFTGISAVTYYGTGESIFSLMIAPVIGLATAASFLPGYLDFSESSKVREENTQGQNMTLDILLTDNSGFEKEMLEKYKSRFF